MPKYNRKCLYCGNPYYACSVCIGINSWKNVCCSVECFRKYMKTWDKEVKPIQQEEGEVVDMYIALKDKNKKLKVVGYDLNLDRIDAEDGHTYVPKDIENIIISYDELKEISKLGE